MFRITHPSLDRGMMKFWSVDIAPDLVVCFTVDEVKIPVTVSSHL